MSDSPQLIFLISLPRSGSTLLQRMLTSSPDIHSVSEPWLMLPFAYMFKKGEMLTRYSHRTFMYAIEDFTQLLPGGRADFHQSLHDFALDIYKKTCSRDEVKFFIDKTPRYYLIIPFLAEVFPDAKFIFLFRNPLEVLASILTTWMNNKFYIHNNYIDIFSGPRALAEGAKAYKNRSISIHYEDIVRDPEVSLQKICAYLGTSYDSSMIEEYGSVSLRGEMGDHRGMHEFSSVSADSLKKWKKVLNTRYRKRFASKYIRTLGNGILREFNTSVETLSAEINSISQIRGGSFQDAFNHALSTSMRLFGKEHYRQLLKGFQDKKPFYPYC